MTTRDDALLDRVGWSALRYRAFRIFFGSMLLSTTANFVYYAALGWYVAEVTGSAAAVGLSFTAYGAAGLLLTAHAGVLTDRYGSKPMLVLSIALMALASLAMAPLTLLVVPPLPVILLLAFLLGLAQTLGAPAVVGIVNDLVPPPAISSSIALNFLHMNVARIVGGLLGGAVLAIASPAVAFVFTGLLGGLPVLLALRLPASTAATEGGPVTPALRSFREALDYAVRFPTLGVITTLAIVPGLVGLSYIFMLPVAAQELGAGPGGLGTLLAASGVGGLVAGLSLERIQRRIGHGKAMLGGLGLGSAALVAFGLAPTIELASLALVVVGGSILTYAAANVTLISALSPSRMRGRLVSMFALFYWGMLPVGSAVLGFIAEPTSARFAVLLGGIALATAAFVVWRIRPQIATLAITRDGVTLTGDLAGSGVEPVERAA